MGRTETVEELELAAARRALEKARTAPPLGLQEAEGWWKGELETNVTMDAEDLLLREFLGIRQENDTAGAAAWIRSKQRSDGTWATYHGGPGDLSTTVEAYCALRLAGDDPVDAHMARAAAFVRDAGGVENSRVFTRIWLALFGLWPWEDLPTLPPEIVALPAWVPCNIYDFGCWARQTAVAITVVGAYRPVRPAVVRHRGAADVQGPRPPGTVAARLDRTFRPARPRPPALRADREPAAAAPDGAGGSAAQGRDLDRPAPGGRWQLGGHPTAVGLLDPRVASAGLPPRPPRARRGLRGPRALSRARRTAYADSRPVSPRSGTRRSPSIGARRRRGRSPDDEALQRATSAGRSARRSACAATGRCADHGSPREAGRSSSRTTTTPTSTTPPRSCSRVAPRRLRGPDRARGRGATCGRLDRGHGVQGRRVGCLRRRQRSADPLRAPLLRFRRGHRPPERGRHRPRRRDARPRAVGGSRGARRGGRLAARASRRRTEPGSDVGA